MWIDHVNLRKNRYKGEIVPDFDESLLVKASLIKQGLINDVDNIGCTIPSRKDAIYIDGISANMSINIPDNTKRKADNSAPSLEADMYIKTQ